MWYQRIKEWFCKILEYMGLRRKRSVIYEDRDDVSSSGSPTSDKVECPTSDVDDDDDDFEEEDEDG